MWMLASSKHHLLSEFSLSMSRLCNSSQLFWKRCVIVLRCENETDTQVGGKHFNNNRSMWYRGGHQSTVQSSFLIFDIKKSRVARLAVGSRLIFLIWKMRPSGNTCLATSFHYLMGPKWRRLFFPTVGGKKYHRDVRFSPGKKKCQPSREKCHDEKPFKYGGALGVMISWWK